MTTDKEKKNDTVEAALEIARIVTKSNNYGARARKAARNFLKRKREQREQAAPALLEIVIDEKGLSPDLMYDAGAILLAITGAKTKTSKVADKEQAEPPKFSEIQDEPAAPRPSSTIVVKSVEEAIAQAEGKHLGDLCGWSLTGSRPKDLVEQLAQKHNLVDDLAFPKLTPTACYKKAISQVFTSGKKLEYMAVLVENSTDKMVHSLVVSKVVDSGADTVSVKDAAFTTEIKVGFNKEAYRNGASAAACLIVEDHTHSAAIQLKETYLELAETYLTHDIRYAFQSAFRKWDACGVLPHGGLWYIPAIHAEKVRSWNGFMIDLGMSTVIIPTFDTVETIASLREATRNGLEGQLIEVISALDSYSEQGWQKTRTSTLEARMANFEELRNRADLYKNILGTTIDDLMSKVKHAADQLAKNITTRNEQEERDAKEAAEAKATQKKAKKEARAAEKEAAKKA